MTPLRLSTEEAEIVRRALRLLVRTSGVGTRQHDVAKAVVERLEVPAVEAKQAGFKSNGSGA